MAIPGAVENLQPPGAYHLGIPESIHSPSTKLFMVIDPVTLFSTPSEAGNSVRLWVNGQATSVIKPIKPGEENNRIFGVALGSDEGWPQYAVLRSHPGQR
jgi:hypothetical protein